MDVYYCVNGRRKVKGKGLVGGSCGVGVLLDEEKVESMMEMIDEE